MTTLDPNEPHVVLINTFQVKPGRAEELVERLAEATEKGIRNAPGFLSANFHVSLDGARVVNYAQWRSREDFEALTASDSFKAHIEPLNELFESFEPVLYELRYSHAREPSAADG